jgi:hypothetical protein
VEVQLGGDDPAHLVDGGERLGLLAQRLLGRLPLGDVAGDLRGADDAPVGGPDGRDRQRDVYERAVLAAADGLVVLDALARADAREDGRLLVDVVFGEEGGDGLADDLLGRVAEDALGPLVPTGDDAFERLADDGVVGRLDDGGEPRLRHLRVAEVCGLFSLCGGLRLFLQRALDGHRHTYPVGSNVMGPKGESSGACRLYRK